MLNINAHLAANIFDKPSLAASREGFGKGSVEAGQKNPHIVVLSADLSESTRADSFQKMFPDRFSDVGVAEQHMVTCAAGMAAEGMIPFITSYATFSPGRNWEQIRTTVCINNMPVKICGMHAGLLTGPDGATHQALEDLTIMRALPNMVVISPCDAEEGRKATLAAAENGTPVYLRFAREKMPTMTTPETQFEIGKAIVFFKPEKSRVALFSTGPVTYNALLAAKKLTESGIATSLINIHTLKPLDEETILTESKNVDLVVTVEEHQVNGGLGGAIAELLSEKYPKKMLRIGVQDHFGESGTGEELYKEFGLDVEGIIASVRSVL